MTTRAPIFGFLVVASVFGIIAWAYWPTVVALSTHDHSYRHIVLVFAAFVVIVWRQRIELSALPIQPFWPGLVVLMGLGTAWLTGELNFVGVLSDVAVVMMVAATIMTILGYRWLWALAFPLSFLLFIIPIRGPLVPTLVDWTAKFAVMWLQASGIPIHQEGAYFTLPSGRWSVAESCSGIENFTNFVMLGCLYAWTLYRSFLKRIVFIAGAAAIGIVGNWIRVYLTVGIAHISDNRLLRDDHSNFGWGVFAILLIGYCGLGLVFRDGEFQHPVAGVPNPGTGGRESWLPKPSSRLQLLSATAIVLVTLLVWPTLKDTLGQHQQFKEIKIVDIVPQAGWVHVDNTAVGWAPELQNPSRVRVQNFQKAGRCVGVFVAVFRNQNPTSKLVTSVNQFVRIDNPDWKLVVRGVAQTEFAGTPLIVDSGILDGRGVRLVAWRWYWIDGTATSNGLLAKAQQVLARFRGKDDTAAWVAIYSEANPSSEVAVNTLQEFIRDMGSSMQAALYATTQ